VTGEIIGIATTEGLDFAEILHYGRNKRWREDSQNDIPGKRKYAQKPGNVFIKIVRSNFMELSYRTGATRADSWIDIEGGFWESVCKCISA